MYLGDATSGNFTLGSGVILSFQLSAAGQTYFAATNLSNLFFGADLSAIQNVLAGMSIFSNGAFKLANAQWDDSSLPSVLTLTITPQAAGIQYAVTAIAAAIADTLNNYFGNVGNATFTPIGLPGTGTQTIVQPVASAITLNPLTLATEDWNLLTSGFSSIWNSATGNDGTAGGTPKPTSTFPWKWVLLGIGGLVLIILVVE